MATASRAAAGRSPPACRRRTATVASAPGRVKRVAVRNSRSSSQSRAVAASPRWDRGQRHGERAPQEPGAQRPAGGGEPDVVAGARGTGGVRRARRGRRRRRAGRRGGSRAQLARVARAGGGRGVGGLVGPADDELGLRVEQPAAQGLGGAPGRLRGARRRGGRGGRRVARTASVRASAAQRPSVLELDPELAGGLRDLARDGLGLVLRLAAERVGILGRERLAAGLLLAQALGEAVQALQRDARSGWPAGGRPSRCSAGRCRRRGSARRGCRRCPAGARRRRTPSPAPCRRR